MRSSISPYLPLAVVSQAVVARAASPLYEGTINITDFGVIKGRAALNSSQDGRVPNWQNISYFGGVPYGADTSGDLRWAESARATAWNGTLDATAAGPLCPSSSNTDAMVAEYGESEDCLTLNIWTPATSADDLLPVVFFTHDDGTAPGDALYDGSGLASKGFVFITYNYRTGVLGYFADPALKETWAEVTGPTGNETGNWGVADQLHALKWVYANVALFGGDPDHISVVGTGAGAAAVWHIINEEELSEFDIAPVNAIAQSGLRSPGDPLVRSEPSAGAYYNQTYAEALATSVLQSLNVSTTAEARALPFRTLVDATADITFRPVLDYFFIPDTYAESLRNGSEYKVPFITGHNADDEAEALLSSTSTTTSSETANGTTAYSTWVADRYGSDYADAFLALYPDANDTTVLERDQARTSSWAFMGAYANSSNPAAYTYYFSLPASSGAAGPRSEVPYALANLWAQPAAGNYTATDYAISDTLSAYWANFLLNGDPNNSTGLAGNTTALPATWEPVSSAEEETFQVGSSFGAISVAGSSEKVSLFEEYFAAQPQA